MERSGVDFSPAYGQAASLLLSRIQPYITSAVESFTQRYYALLDRSSTQGEVIARLSPDEFERMKADEADYMTALAAPDLSMGAHQTRALRAGRTHALTGVEMQWVIESIAYYQECFGDLVLKAVASSAEREQILRTISLRALYDLHEQSGGYSSVRRDISSVQTQIDRIISSTGNLFDMLHGILAELGSLPGDVSGFFAREDANGELQIEATFGVADRYHQAMEVGTIPKISIDASKPNGQGPTGRSWRSGAIAVSDSWVLEPDRAPWVVVGKQLGFRSSAAVPILDESGRTVASFSLYCAYPGFFSTNRVMRVLTHLRDAFSHAAAIRMRAPVIPLDERLHYRRLLEHHRVVVHYQPIVDLRTGIVDRFEALARLQDHAGSIVPPGDFVFALGDSELYTLFIRVLRQCCIDYQQFARDGLRMRFAINIPAQALGDMRYADAIFAHLTEYGLTPNVLILEILETQGDQSDLSRHEEFISHLRTSGIEIEQDDLGSGHSSLVRMDRYPFDAVKLDQALVRGSMRNPKRALEFMLYLTRLAHALATPVTIEGLEDASLLEAAAILGADRGQGYGIAEPMPASRVVEWHRTFEYGVDIASPRTTLGAMAASLTMGLTQKVVDRFE